ncbi:TIM-barrel domain-containing protein [Longitalea arenae]|uniref:TIM-barrel domain-containing protein n=1 Tax=Longitalea arenae TaxID=2812558 RepID=UPI0019686AA7|nr:TIM-barrel domain-containing protein [Longitalea arenae]
MKLPIKTLLVGFFALVLVGSIVIISAQKPAPRGFTKLEDGVIVKVEKPYAGGAGNVKLQVVNDQIIHVSAAAGDTFSATASLMADPKKRNPAWKLEEKGDELILQTAVLRAIVSRSSGNVRFTDLKGQVILKEVPTAGRSFVKQKAGDKATYSISQSFESPEGEAWYGLGQHQQGLFNYRGTQVSLLQQNSEVAIPFMVSNRNYGLLWDNYSISRFGDCRPFEPLHTLSLTGADGSSGALTATYYSGKNADSVFLRRNEREIDYEFIQSLSKLPAGFPLQNGRVVWEGSVTSSFTGQHSFLFSSGGYLKYWLDGKLLVDKWRQCWNPITTLVQAKLEKAKKYPVKIEWIPDGGESYLAMKWLSPIPDSNRNTFSFWSEAGDNIDYYFVYGSNMDEIIAGYRELTGRATLLPNWAMGFWQSRERYKTQEELLSVVKEFRQRKIPLDNIVLDWFYWKPDQWGSHEFDASRFPNAENMIKDLHEKYNTHFMISVWPKFYTGTQHYDLFNEKGWLYKQNVLNNQKDWVGYVSTFYDAYNPQARELFWKLMNEKLYSKGVDAWWMDATEPDVLSNTNIEERKKLITPAVPGSSTSYFNSYALENAKGVYEGQRRTNALDRVFILTRSAYAGMQRYAAVTWSGDIGARWNDLQNQVAAGINFSLSGLPYWTSDIGGFSVEKRFENATGANLDEWRELMTRWYQFGAFCPIFRVHGQFPYREILHVAPADHPAYKSMLYYNQLRYRLMPYIYTLAAQTYHNNYTIMRPLVMDFPNDKAVLNIGDQYMFGPSLLVNPVYTYKARNRTLHLPANTGWYDFYTGVYQAGGQKINAAAAYERMPLYVREGSIVPMGPDLQYTGEKPADPVTLYVYTGKDAAFTLYEDEGTNYNYEKGAFANIPISWNEANKTLTIGKRSGSFPGMLNNRTFNIMWVSKTKALTQNNKPAATIRYQGESVSVTMK